MDENTKRDSKKIGMLSQGFLFDKDVCLKLPMQMDLTNFSVSLELRLSQAALPCRRSTPRAAGSSGWQLDEAAHGLMVCKSCVIRVTAATKAFEALTVCNFLLFLHTSC